MNKHQPPTKIHKPLSLIHVMISTGLVVWILLLGFRIIRKQVPSVEAADEKESTAIVHRATAESNSGTQAESFFQQIKSGLQQPRLFPFKPELSGETYDPEIPLDAPAVERLKRHVMLRNFYTSPARLTAEFKALSDLLADHGLELDPILIRNLYTCLEWIESNRNLPQENPELVAHQIRHELDQMTADDTAYAVETAKNLLPVEDALFWSAFFEIRPKVPFPAPDTRVEPGEYLLIR